MLSRIATPRRIGALLGLALALAAGSVAAHHGWSGYDADRPLTISGALTAVNYGNPHVDVTVQTAEKRWEVILAPVSRMEARGAGRELLQVGKTVSVEGYPSRQKPDEMRAERISIDGRTYELR